MLSGHQGHYKSDPTICILNRLLLIPYSLLFFDLIPTKRLYLLRQSVQVTLIHHQEALTEFVQWLAKQAAHVGDQGEDGHVEQFG